MSKPTESTASGGGKGVGPSRRTWDTDSFERKAMSREKRQAELETLNAERRSQGLPPVKRLKSNAPEPELSMQQRRMPLNLTQNEGKTLMVDLASDAKGQTGPGFYCEVCRKLLKDNLAYLDHVNGRVHLMRIGQSTQQDRATLDEVREMLQRLKKQRAEGGAGANKVVYDFDERIRKIAEQEEKERQEKREKRRQQKLSKKSGSNRTEADVMGDSLERKQQAAPDGGDGQDAMLAAMGFGGFGSTKKH